MIGTSSSCQTILLWGSVCDLRMCWRIQNINQQEIAADPVDESGALNNQWSLSAVPTAQMGTLREGYRFCCWRNTADNVIHIYLIKDIFHPPPPTVDQNEFLWPVLPDPPTEICARTQISVDFLICSWAELMGQMIVKLRRQRVQQPRTTSLSFSGDEYHCLTAMCHVLVHLARKGNGRWHPDCFNSCYTQKAPMTNSV